MPDDVRWCGTQQKKAERTHNKKNNVQKGEKKWLDDVIFIACGRYTLVERNSGEVV